MESQRLRGAGGKGVRSGDVSDRILRSKVCFSLSMQQGEGR